MGDRQRNKNKRKGLTLKKYTIELENEVAHVLEVRAAIDNMKPEQGIEALLTELVAQWAEGKRI